MKNFIKGLQIIAKYVSDQNHPFYAERDVFYIYCNTCLVSQEDIDVLKECGFVRNENDNDTDGFLFFT